MEQMQPFNFRQARSFGEIIGDTFTFLRLNFKPLFMNLLVIAGPFVLIGTIINSVLSSYLQRTILANPLGTLNIGFYLDTLKTSGMSGIVGIINISLIATVAYSYIVLSAGRGGRPPEREEVSEAFRRNFVAVFVSILIYSFLVLIGSIFLFIPGLYLIVALSPMLMVRIAERSGPGEAVGRSIRLMSGHWWQTFGLGVVLIIICYILLLPLSLPMSIVMLIFVVKGDSAIWNIPMIVLSSIVGFASSFIYTLPMITIALQYYNLVERKESAGLMARVEQMGSSSSTDTAHHPL